MNKANRVSVCGEHVANMSKLCLLQLEALVTAWYDVPVLVLVPVSVFVYLLHIVCGYNTHALDSVTLQKQLDGFGLQPST